MFLHHFAYFAYFIRYIYPISSLSSSTLHKASENGIPKLFATRVALPPVSNNMFSFVSETSPELP